MVSLFCVLLTLGIAAGQAVDLSFIRGPLVSVSSVCLAYIMIEVGLEFSIEKKKITDHGWDAVVAFSAAILPALLWFWYFMAVVHSAWQPSLLSGLSSAPTSAGVLFAMLMAAGLSATWVFKKARVLAVLDDLVVILLLAPLQIVIHGFEWRSLAVFILISVLLFAAFRWQNSIRLPVSKNWLLVYGFLLTALIFAIEHAAHIHLGVLIPAFVWGCLIKDGGGVLVHLRRFARYQNGWQSPQSRHRSNSLLDFSIKAAFMFLVGASFPKVSMGSVPIGSTVAHVLVLTLLANLGKCFPFLCYRREASVKERLALSVAMFPRGEVGAAVLLIAVGYGLGGYANTLAMLSLAFNLVLTGLFVWIVTKLLNTTISGNS